MYSGESYSVFYNFKKSLSPQILLDNNYFSMSSEDNHLSFFKVLECEVFLSNY
jgi:hypothetical protein